MNELRRNCASFSWPPFLSAMARPSGAWLAVLLVITVAIVALSLWNDAREMDPMEHYSLRGCYQIVYVGMPAAGAIVVLWFIVRQVWRLVRRARVAFFSGPTPPDALRG